MGYRSLSLLGAATLFAAAIGCGPNGPTLVIGNGSSFDFGSVTIGLAKESVISVKNTGDAGLTLGAIDNINLSGAFSRTGGSCSSGMSLGKGASCTIAVTFAPQVRGLAAGQIVIGFKDNKGKDKSSSLAVAGTGLLDCTKDPDLLASYNQGIGAANTRNTSEANAGAAAGTSLTYTDGRNDSYTTAYNAAYTAAYNTAYTIAYNSAYDYWRLAGNYDTVSCQTGTTDGDNVGYADGVADGRHDGYLAGYNEAYAASYTNGYNAGYSQARSECSVTPYSAKSLKVLGPQVIVAAKDPSDLQACYDQGFSATYNPASYTNSYNYAKAHNANYQNGYSAGLSEGQANGQTDGTAAGNVAGDADGRHDGWIVGTNEAYTSCYNTAYAYAYSSGYSSGYADTYYGYPAGYDDGDVDGYADGNYQGYVDGQAAYCGTTTTTVQTISVKSTPSLFGSDQTWAVTSNSLTVDTYASRPALSLSTDAQGKKSVVKNVVIEKIRKEVSLKLARDLKPQLRIKSSHKAVKIDATAKLRKMSTPRTERPGILE